MKQQQKGKRGEYQVRDILRKYTGLQFERTPSSGALGPHLKLKGDLFVPNRQNNYCIEVKNYKEDCFMTKTMVNKSNEFRKWWEQAVRQAKTNNTEPLLCYKWNRGPWMVVHKADTLPTEIKSNYIYFSEYDIIIMKLEDCLSEFNLEFVI